MYSIELVLIMILSNTTPRVYELLESSLNRNKGSFNKQLKNLRKILKYKNNRKIKGKKSNNI